MMKQMKSQKNVLSYSKERYQNTLEESMKSRKFVFDYVNLLFYKCRKINMNHGGSYIDSLDQIKNKKATINLYQ